MSHNQSVLNEIELQIASGNTAVSLVLQDWKACKEVSHEGIFVSYVSDDDFKAALDELVDRLKQGENLPLAGTTFTVKDNIDVKGLVTSSNCPGFGSIPEKDATCVENAKRAGAILIGKTTMDQFATGLNGTRSPEPLCRNSINPDYIPGGSSSGSGVSVARQLVTFSFGSDTGGSGRVPAAANGIIGLKPSIGLISAAGLIYCNRSFDVVPIFTRFAIDAFVILDLVSGYDQRDPYSRTEFKTYPKAQTGGAQKLAIPQMSSLQFFGDKDAKSAFEQNIDKLSDSGFEIIETDFAPFGEAGDMVFKSPLVAERLVDYGKFIQDNPNKVVPSVKTAIQNGRQYTAEELYQTLHRLQELKIICHKLFDNVSALVVPTIPRLFRIDEMLANPLELNTIMGTYTYFANPLDLCSVAVPGVSRADGFVSSLCFNAPAGQDEIIKEMALTFEN